MTWNRTRPEVIGQMAADGLTQDAAMAHLCAVHWLHGHERDDGVIPRRLLPAALLFADDHALVAKELADAGYWRQHTDGSIEIVDHRDVLRQSLGATRAKRDKDRRGQQRQRDRKRDPSSDDAPDESTATLPNYLTTDLDQSDTTETWRVSGDEVTWPPVARREER